MTTVPTRSADARDPSNGWEAVAREFIASRPLSTVGVAEVRTWARSLPSGAAVLDLGCGCGAPISQVLIQEGFSVYGVDASPSMVEAFRRRFPGAHLACEPVETSSFFSRNFDAALAWGLMFLLPEPGQRDLIRRVARALGPGGRFLFTAPAQVCAWPDSSTGRPSLSLGADAYRAELAEAGLVLVGEQVDDNDNHYYSAVRSELLGRAG